MNEVSNIIDINEDEFNDKVVEASQNKLIIVDFWAPWCGPCKQLTPVLEKIINNSGNKVTLVKVNIDDNQQIAAQLNIQSIPVVYAFKNKQVVNAFQGAMPEKQIIAFIEKCLGSKIGNDFSEFYSNISSAFNEKKFAETKEDLIEFIANNPSEINAKVLYLECLIELKEYDDSHKFIDSLEKDIQNKDEIKQIVKKLNLIKNNLSGPNIDELLKNLDKKPGNIDLILEISEKYFSEQEYENCMNLLLETYPKHKEKIKVKMLEFFSILGDSNEHTVHYRKKLSQIMFS